ncbi:hypothetical protein ACFLTC_01435, partial [Chloroflexota bacterium]
MRKRVSTMVAVVLMALLVVASAPPAAGAQYDIVVIGSNDPDLDVNKVQWAVDNYNRILLKGTFDFGDWGTVAVTRDVEIHGEKSRNVYNTKIIGGQIPFLVGSSATGPYEFFNNPDALVPVNSFAIRDISFENAMVAVGVASCHGDVRITGNEVVDGRLWDFGSWSFSAGIYVGSVAAANDPGVVTGNITIANNQIDGRGRSWAAQPEDDPWAVHDPDFGRWYRGIVNGIYFSNVAAHADIVGNRVVNTLNTGIAVNNSPALSDEMSATVTRNSIAPSADEMYGDP